MAVYKAYRAASGVVVAVQQNAQASNTVNTNGGARTIQRHCIFI